MNDTLIDGDIVLINKVVYGGRLPSSIAEIPWLNILTVFFSDKTQLEKEKLSTSRFLHFGKLKRGDVVVINDPWNRSGYLVKRCIAIEGDTICMNHHLDLLVNGIIIEEFALVKKAYTVDYSKTEISKKLTFSKLTDSLRIPYYEDKLQKTNPIKNIYLNFNQKQLLISKIGNEFITPSNCSSFFFTTGVPEWKNISKENVDNLHNNECNHFFVMGDNRCFSTDSRHFGFVPENLLIGKIEFVLFSLSKNKELRKKRIFVTI